GSVVAERGARLTPEWLGALSGTGLERAGRLVAVYRDGWKLVVTSTGTRLYDLRADPREERDVAGANPRIVRSLSTRIPGAFDARPDLGPIPSLAVIASGDADAAIGHMADARYTVGRPLVRVALAPGGGAENPPRVLLAAHHAALDGLGLLALLGVALGAEV